MSLCASGILMGAVSSVIVLTDLLHRRTDRMVSHLFLGGIATLLFFVLCQQGYEIFNWILLASFPLYLILRWVFSPRKKSDDYTRGEVEVSYEVPCNSCNKPESDCGCSSEAAPPPPPPPKRCPDPTYKFPEIQGGGNYNNKKDMNCPANPINLSTKCGISRFSSFN